MDSPEPRRIEQLEIVSIPDPLGFSEEEREVYETAKQILLAHARKGKSYSVTCALDEAQLLVADLRNRRQPRG